MSNYPANKAVLVAIVAGIATACTWTATAFAEEPESLQEITVTAQRRQQSVQDVGVSITAVTADQLRERGVTSSKDIAKVAPGVVFDATASGGVNANLTVRGISQTDFSSNQESPNSVYVDDIYLSSPNEAAFTLYDLNRIEVLRGPQGTLFGRNSTGGLANFISAKPTNTFEAYAEAGAGSFDEHYVEGAVSGPLSDRVRVRFSGREERNDGWWENHAPGGHNGFEKRFAGARAQIEADITDELMARFSLSYDGNPRHYEGTYKAVNYYYVNGKPVLEPANVDGWGTGPGNDLAGYRDPYRAGPVSAFDNIGFLVNRRVSPTLDLEWKHGSTTFTSLTNFTDFSFNYREECDGTPIYYCEYNFNQQLRQFSQELRATGHTGGLTWTAGLYYLNISQDVFFGFQFPSYSGTAFAFNDINPVTQHTTSFAPFGQIEWMLTDELRLTAGARYTEDHKTFSSQVYFNELGSAYGGTGLTVPPALFYDFSAATVGDAAKVNEGLPSGKVQLDYLLGDGKMLYAGVSRGVKSAGFNTNISGFLADAATPFKSEFVTAYEVGEKLDLLDRHLRLNSSAFYYDYHRFQGFAFTGLQGVVGNYDAQMFGGEMEVVASLPSDVLVNLGVSFNHSLLKDIPTAYNGIRDEQAPLAPKWILDGSLHKSVNIGPGKLGLLWSFDYIGSRYASVDNNPATYVRSSIGHNARMTYDFDFDGKPVELSAYCNNVFNAVRENFSYDLIASTGSQLVSYAPPRWFGASIRVSFK